MSAQITATLYDEDGAGTPLVLTNASAKSFLVERNAPGTGTLRLPLTDDQAPEIDYDRVVVFSYAGEEPKSWVIETIDWNVVDEAGSRFVQATGRGLEGPWLEGAAVYPVGGMKRKSAAERHFNFASVDSYAHDLGVTWVKPGAITWDDRVGPLAGYPLDWPDIQCRWIWAGAPYALVAAETPNWFRRRFTTTARYAMRLFATADNGADIYIDGEQVLTFPHNESGNWRKTFTSDFTLEAGTHVIAIEARNSTNPTTPTPAGVIAMITTLTSDGDPDAVILRTSAQFQVSTDEPGWLAGDVLYTLVTEAQARGAGRLANLTLDFDAVTDSNGAPWTVQVKKSWNVAFDNLLTVASDLAELGIDFWITADRVLHAAQARGTITSVTLKRGQDVGDPSVQAWTVSGQRATATHAWILTAKGWVQASDTAGLAAHGRLEVGLEVGNTDSDDTADEVAAAAFAKAAAPVETVRGTSVIPAAGAIAFVDYGIGDVVNGWDRSGDAAQVRILSLTVSEDDDNKVTYSPEFDVYDASRPRPFPPRLPAQDAAVAARKAFPGGMAGKVRSTGAGNRAGRSLAASGLATGGGPGGNGGGTATTPPIAWFEDQFEVTPGNLGPFQLTYRPLVLSEDVKLNGIGLPRGDAWTRTDTVVTVDAAAFDGIDGTWLLTVHYQHSGITGSPTDAPDTGVNDITPLFVARTDDTFPETIADGDVALLFVRDDGGTPSGGFATWERLRDSTGGMDLWLGTGVGTGTTTTMPIGFADAGVLAVFRGVASDVAIASLEATLHNPPSGSPVTAPAVDAPAGAIVISAAVMTPGSGGDWALAGTYTADGITGPAHVNGGNSFYNIALVAGLASGGSVATAFDITGSAGDGGEVVNVAFTAVSVPADPDPATYEPGGTYTPPPPPPTPSGTDLSWAPPASSGWTEREINPAGETIVLSQTEDWLLSATDIVTGPVTIVGGRNINLIGLIGEQSTTVPTGSYDAERRGLRFKDGPNPNIARSIHCEGLWFREGYYSDPIQLAFRTENAVTFVLQNLRVDAVVYGGNTSGLVHADLVQFYGGPRTFLSDGVTAKHLTYQGAYLDPGDKRALPVGAGLPWQIRRWNLEEDDMNGGAHYLLADRRPAFSQMVCDEVYVLGGKNVNDTFGRFPTVGVHRDASPAGGDFVPASLWTGDTYTSPGYV